MEENVVSRKPAYKAEDKNFENFKINKRLKVKNAKLEKYYAIISRANDSKNILYSKNQQDIFVRSIKIK